MEQKVVISYNLGNDILSAIEGCEHDIIFIITDTNTSEACLPVLAKVEELNDAINIIVKATDCNKNLESLAEIWTLLCTKGATRHSCVINLGGGMITDLGGFAASTFKRGVNFINIPTTLLAMVDASVGGKTGINFCGLKNEVGVFNNAKYVILCTEFLKTLDSENIRSGYAEMLKHGLLCNNTMWAELINFDLDNPNLIQLQKMVGDSVGVKADIVAKDPLEMNLRKALNLGHTIGHAFESFAMKKGNPVLHGYAVAYGMICELYLSVVKTGFPVDKMRQTVSYIKEYFGKMIITCDDYDELYELMKHDKKNTSDQINFTLLGEVGDIRIDNFIDKKDIYDSLDFYREC